MPSSAAPLIYLLAGEQSGDVLGARLMTALRDARPDVSFAGVGGVRMTDAGLASLFPMQDLAVMGLFEVLPRVRLLRRRLAQVEADIRRRRPDVLVTIDSPGFALRLLRKLTGAGIPRVHYVAPQVWAWREKRVRHFPGLWERLLCLLPFEPDFFAEHGIEATFVGHPVLESGAGDGDGARFRARFDLRPSDTVVILMPGSRATEVGRLLPIFERTVALLGARVPDLVPVVPIAPTIADRVRAATAAWPRRPVVVTGFDDKHDAYAAASAALTKSGTSTLELALAGVPMAVTYRVNPVSAFVARRLIRVPHVAMVNLLAGDEVVPELLQEACTPARLADTLYGLLTENAQGAAQRGGFYEALSRLAVPGSTPSAAAAARVLEMIEADVASEPIPSQNSHSPFV